MKAHYEPCLCGRTTIRFGPIAGHKKQMVTYIGTALYPTVLKNILNHCNQLDCFGIEINHNAMYTDEKLIKIASDNPSDLLFSHIKNRYRSKLRVTPKIKWVIKCY